MPVYEYRCRDCRRRVSLFWRSMSDVDAEAAVCPRCGGADLVRLMSRTRVVRSAGGGPDDVPDVGDMAGLPDLDENDPRSLGRWMRKMSAETGEDLGPEFDEVVGRLESGEDPESIERSMPELMGDGGEGFDDGLDL